MPRCAGFVDQIGAPIALAPPRPLSETLSGSWRRPAALQAVRRPRADWFELLVLVVFLAASAWVLALELARVGSNGAVWNGTTSPYPIDQLQYLSWIKDASNHLLASNLFVLHGTSHDYLEPMVVASAGLVVLGVAPAIALLVWQPVAIVAVFGTVWLLIRRQLSGCLETRIALCLALFAGLPSMYVDLWLPFWTWGYQVALLALACALGSLLIYDRARHGGRGIWLAAPLGALASWLHPWQGEVLVVMIAGAELAMWLQGARPRVLRPLAVIAMSVLPLVYYVILQRLDPSWRLGQFEASGSPSLTTVLVPIGLLGLPALLAYRLRPLTFVQAATRVWPFAALAVFFASRAGLGSSPTHSLLGITIPLAVLGVQGLASLGRGAPIGPAASSLRPFAFSLRPAASRSSSAFSLRPHRGRGASTFSLRRRRSFAASRFSFGTGRGLASRRPAGARRPRLGGVPPLRTIAVGLAATAAVLALTIPAAVSKFSLAHRLVREMRPPRRDEQRALNFLAHDPQPGGVLTGIHLGAMVPMDTGRHTYIGDCYWSLPYCEDRNTDAWLLLGWARLSPREAESFIFSTGARFVLKDCHEKARVWRKIRLIVVATHQFGCASVYEIANPWTFLQ